MRLYKLYPQRHARIAMRGLSKEERARRDARELLTWKRDLIQGLRLEFPGTEVQGIEADGIIVSLPQDSPTYLRLLQMKLDCVFQLQPEAKASP